MPVSPWPRRSSILAIWPCEGYALCGDLPSRFVLTSSRKRTILGPCASAITGRASMPVLSAPPKLPTYCGITYRPRGVVKKRDGNNEGPCPGARPDGCLHRRCHRCCMVGLQDTVCVNWTASSGPATSGGLRYPSGRRDARFRKPICEPLHSSVAEKTHHPQPNKEKPKSD
jgi:hypothetical protein